MNPTAIPSTSTEKTISPLSAFTGFLGECGVFAAEVTFPLIARTAMAFVAFTCWPIVPALLWNWSEKTEITEIGMQIANRTEWLFATPGIGFITAATLTVGFAWRCLKVAHGWR